MEGTKNLQGKKIYAFGDSIVYGHTAPEKSFMRLIASETGIDLGMYAVNGATVMKGDNDILSQVEAAPKESPDLIVLDGYTNDAYEPVLQLLGEIRKDSVTGFDEGTFCGCFENLLHTIRRKWPGTPVLYVTIHKSGGREWNVQCRLRELAMEICCRWDVETADIFQCSLDTREPDQMRAMIIDGEGSHPNERCCWEYYVPIVLDKIRELT